MFCLDACKILFLSVSEFVDVSPVPGSVPLGLSVPTQPSPHVLGFLFSLSSQLKNVSQFSSNQTSSAADKQVDVLGLLLTDMTPMLLSAFESLYGKSADDLLAAEPTSTSTLSSASSISHAPAPVKLQTFFDLLFLFSILRVPSSATSRFSLLYALALSSLSSSVDPIEWSASRSVLLHYCAVSLKRVQLLLENITGRHNHLKALKEEPKEIKESSSKSSSNPVLTSSASASLNVNILSLAPSSSRMLPLPVALYPNKHDKAEREREREREREAQQVAREKELKSSAAASANSKAFTAASAAVSNAANNAAAFASSVSLASVAADTTVALDNIKQKGKEFLGKFSLY